MAGIVYLIRNGDLHKIGTTTNLQRRMKQLKPDEIVKTLETTKFRAIEKELHRKYKDVRLPQTEYWGKQLLANEQVRLSHCNHSQRIWKFRSHFLIINPYN